MDELRPKQKEFVKEYLSNGGNATQAVIDAGYDVNNRDTARSIGTENLSKPLIKKALAEMIPDDLLMAKHIALLNKVDEKGEIDVQAVKAGVDMAYKVKGTYATESSPPPQVNIVLVKFLDGKNNRDTK